MIGSSRRVFSDEMMNLDAWNLLASRCRQRGSSSFQSRLTGVPRPGAAGPILQAEPVFSGEADSRLPNAPGIPLRSRSHPQPPAPAGRGPCRTGIIGTVSMRDYDESGDHV